ncbi:MAG: PqqD family protein [Clostridia bacterium]|nr:PqqD family protein [Clostridia bacterium]
MKLKNGFLLKELAGDHVVVPVGQAALDLRGMITLNETGAFLWERLQTGQTEDALVSAMLEEYDVAPDIARKDVRAFVEMLRQQQLLED